MHQSEHPPPHGKRGPTHPASHAAANCVRLLQVGDVGPRTGQVRDGAWDLPGSDPRPPQLAMTTRRRPMSRGLRCKCSRRSCGMRSVYETCSSGGAWIWGWRFAPGTLQSTHRYRPGLGHIPEFDNGPSPRLHGDRCG